LSTKQRWTSFVVGHASQLFRVNFSHKATQKDLFFLLWIAFDVSFFSLLTEISNSAMEPEREIERPKIGQHPLSQRPNCNLLSLSAPFLPLFLPLFFLSFFFSLLRKFFCECRFDSLPHKKVEEKPLKWDVFLNKSQRKPFQETQNKTTNKQTSGRCVRVCMWYVLLFVGSVFVIVLFFLGSGPKSLG